MKKNFFLVMAALAMAVTSFAQEYMVVEGFDGQTARFNVNAIKQVYFQKNETQGNGTADNPYNVAAIIEQTANLSDGQFFSDGAEVYVTGVITETIDISPQYGNATYYISDDAQGSNRFYVYRGAMLNGAAVASETDIEVGDSVTVCGKIKNYKGLNEFDRGNYLTFIKKGKSGGEVTPGTATAPLTVAQALDYIESLSADVQSPEGYVKGKIASISEVSVQYGNATYAISDDGSEENTLIVYRGYSLGGAKFTSEDEIKVGDEVLIMGKFVYYKGNAKEMVQGSTIYSLNGKTAGGDTPVEEVTTVTIAQFNAAEVSTDVWYQLTGTVVELKDGDLYGNFYLVDGADSVYVYGLLSEKGGAKKMFQELVAAKGIANGKKITIIGNRGEYNGKIEVKNAYFVSIEGGGDDTPADEVTTVTIAQFIAAEVSTDAWYQLTGTISNLKDGDQYGNFDLVDATGSVYVYGLLSEKGGAKKKFQELVAAKGIANGKKITIIGNRGEYNGKIEVTNAYFVSIE